MEGKDISFIFPTITKEMVKNIFSDKIESVEMEVENKDEGARHVNFSITPVHEKNSIHEPLYLCIVRDITLQKKADAELTIRYQKIKDAYEWLGKVQRQNDYITDLIRVVTHEYNFKKIFHSIVNSLIIISSADACEIRSYDDEKNELFLEAHFGFEGDIRSHRSIPFTGSWTEQAAKTGVPYHLMDLATEKKTPVIQHLLSEHFSSSFTVLLKNTNGVAGSITFYTKM